MRLPQPRESFRRPPRGFYQPNTGKGDWSGKGNRCSNQLLTNWNRSRSFAAFRLSTSVPPNFRSSVLNRRFIVGGGTNLYPRHSSLFRRSEAADEVPNSVVAANSWRGWHRIIRKAEASQRALSLPVLRNLQKSPSQ